MGPIVYSRGNDAFPNSAIFAPGSPYARDFSGEERKELQLSFKREIYDRAPRQFLDLQILGKKPFITGWPSFEVSWQEMEHQRKPVIATGAAAGVNHPSTQSFTVQSVDTVAKEMIVVYPTNEEGSVTEVNTSTKTITVTPMTGKTLPAVVANDSFAGQGFLKEDGGDDANGYFRADVINRDNLIMTIERARKYTKEERYIRNNQDMTNFIQMERMKLVENVRMDFSCNYWNGAGGEFTMSNGKRVRSTKGIFPQMVEGGSPTTSATTSTLTAALEDICMSINNGTYGRSKFVYASNINILRIQKAFKNDQTRYTPKDQVVDLTLGSIDFGDVKAFLVPMNRLIDPSQFPAAFANRVMVVDHNLIDIYQTWGETNTQIGGRESGNPEDYDREFWETTVCPTMLDPLSFGYIDVNV